VVGKLDKSVGVAAAGLADDFAAFDRSNLTEESHDKILGHRDVQVANIEGPRKKRFMLLLCFQYLPESVTT
jgi:hypothetical protein